MKLVLRFFPIVLMLLFSACSRETERVEIRRFEQLLFQTPPEALKETLKHEQKRFDCPVLNLQPDNPNYMAMLQGFVTDPLILRVWHSTDSLYHDLAWLETSLGTALAKARRCCPEIEYNRVFTLITADFQNYDNRVFCYGKDMVISIDRYAVGSMQDLHFFGMPAYLVNLCRKENLLADCMAAAARSHIVMPEGDPTFLDYAIAEGKVLWLLDQTLPDTPDSVKIRYSGAQLQWMRDNVENVWGWLIQNKVLYSSDLAQLRNLIDDAPKTNAFGEGSAPRTGAFIGWQIVKQYMKKSGVTASQLFAEPDSRKLLETSGWRP